MEQQDGDILKEFEIESKGLIDSLLEILERCEGDFSQVKSLEQYGQTVDRIMGGASNIALVTGDAHHVIHKIADYSAVCKAVGYKASQIKDNESFYDICVALLLDATETLMEMVGVCNDGQGQEKVRALINPQFIDRLRWVSKQFSAEYSASVGVKTSSSKMAQDDIDELLKKLGF